MINVDWSGPDYPSDYIAVFSPEESNRQEIYYAYTEGTSPQQLTPRPSATYD